MFFYKMVAEWVTSAELGLYETYGIVYCEGNKELFKISDVSCDKAVARRVLRKLNQNNVELCHMADVINDCIQN